MTNLPTQDQVNTALREIGNSLLKQPYKDAWSEDNPTLGYCYVVSEALYHYAVDGTVTPRVISFPEGGTHWYLQTEEGIVDFTSEQFPFDVDYAASNRCPFFKGGVQTSRGYISKRGHIIAQKLGLV